jgi:hypothetical protein
MDRAYTGTTVAPNGGVRALMAVAMGLLTTSCATLGQLGMLVQPPRFERDRDRPAELRLLSRGAGIRLYARVQNPNAFGLRLAHLAGDLFLDDARAARVDLPLGLPLRAYEDTVVPIDVQVDYQDVPQLIGVAGQILARRPIAYRLDGTVGVDAGQLGQPRFGPSTLLTGELQPRR